MRKDYSKLGDVEKDVAEQNGLFAFPTDVKGKTNYGLRKCLIFYFDSEEDYQLVLDSLSIHNTHVKAHPDMDAVKLAEMIRNLEGE